jgi:hypothetical protein
MKGNTNYLILFVLTIILSFFIPNYFLTYYQGLSYIIPTILATGFFAAYLSSNPFVMQHLEKIDVDGKKNENRYYGVTIAAFFAFFFLSMLNQENGKIGYFEKNGITVDAVVLSGEKSTSKSGRRGSSTTSTLQVSFIDKQGMEHQATTEIQNENFEKYSVGQPIKLKYLPDDISFIMIMEETMVNTMSKALDSQK